MVMVCRNCATFYVEFGARFGFLSSNHENRAREGLHDLYNDCGRTRIKPMGLSAEMAKMTNRKGVWEWSATGQREQSCTSEDFVANFPPLFGGYSLRTPRIPLKDTIWILFPKFSKRLIHT